MEINVAIKNNEVINIKTNLFNIINFKTICKIPVWSGKTKCLIETKCTDKKDI